MNELSPEAEALLRSARARFTPELGQREAVRRALSIRLQGELLDPPSDFGDGPSGLGARSPTFPGTPRLMQAFGGGASALKLAGTGLLLLALGAGAYLTLRRVSPSHAPVRDSGGAHETVSSTPPAIAPQATPPAGWSPQPVVEQLVDVQVNPLERVADPGAARADERSARRARPRGAPTSAAAAPVSETRPRSSSGQPTSALEPARSAAQRPVLSVVGSRAEEPRASTLGSRAEEPRASTLGSRAEEPRASTDALREETRLLQHARSELERGQAQRALSTLDQYAAQHAEGVLREEELALRVLALCAADRPDVARLVAARLSALSPRSPHLGPVRASCAGRSAD